MRESTTVVLPDMQVPYQDKKLVEALQYFVKDYQPDQLAHVGDHLDAPEPSRWNKGMAGEYATTLQKSVDESVKILADFKHALGDKPFHFKMGNHDERVETYVSRYAPALTSLADLKMENLLKLDHLGIQCHRHVYDIAPGWVLAHGHEGSLNRVAGSTAMSLARKMGKSVVCGHTHRAGIQHETTGYNGRTQSIYGMEVGHAMSLKDAGYLKYGGANWHQAFGILRTNGRHTTPELVMIQGRSFTVDGKRYDF